MLLETLLKRRNKVEKLAKFAIQDKNLCKVKQAYIIRHNIDLQIAKLSNPSIYAAN